MTRKGKRAEGQKQASQVAKKINVQETVLAAFSQEVPSLASAPAFDKAYSSVFTPIQVLSWSTEEENVIKKIAAYKKVRQFVESFSGEEKFKFLKLQLDLEVELLWNVKQVPKPSQISPKIYDHIKETYKRALELVPSFDFEDPSVEDLSSKLVLLSSYFHYISENRLSKEERDYCRSELKTLEKNLPAKLVGSAETAPAAEEDDEMFAACANPMVIDETPLVKQTLLLLTQLSMLRTDYVCNRLSDEDYKLQLQEIEGLYSAIFPTMDRNHEFALYGYHHPQELFARILMEAALLEIKFEILRNRPTDTLTKDAFQLHMDRIHWNFRIVQEIPDNYHPSFYPLLLSCLERIPGCLSWYDYQLSNELPNANGRKTRDVEPKTLEELDSEIAKQEKQYQVAVVRYNLNMLYYGLMQYGNDRFKLEHFRITDAEGKGNGTIPFTRINDQRPRTLPLMMADCNVREAVIQNLKREKEDAEHLREESKEREEIVRKLLEAEEKWRSQRRSKHQRRFKQRFMATVSHDTQRDDEESEEKDATAEASVPQNFIEVDGEMFAGTDGLFSKAFDLMRSNGERSIYYYNKIIEVSTGDDAVLSEAYFGLVQCHMLQAHVATKAALEHTYENGEKFKISPYTTPISKEDYEEIDSCYKRAKDALKLSLRHCGMAYSKADAEEKDDIKATLDHISGEFETIREHVNAFHRMVETRIERGEEAAKAAIENARLRGIIHEPGTKTDASAMRHGLQKAHDMASPLLNEAFNSLGEKLAESKADPGNLSSVEAPSGLEFHNGQMTITIGSGVMAEASAKQKKDKGGKKAQNGRCVEGERGKEEWPSLVVSHPNADRHADGVPVRSAD